MSVASLTGTKSANQGSAQTRTLYPRRRTVSILQERISELIYFHNRKKAWAYVADKFGLKERAAKHRLSNSSSYTIEELQILFQSENGRMYLEAMMDRAEPTWWKAVRASIQLSDARVLQAQAQQMVMSLDNVPLEQPTRRKLKRFVDADRNLSNSRAEKELTTGLLHQNVNSPVDRAVAQTKRIR